MKRFKTSRTEGQIEFKRVEEALCVVHYTRFRAPGTTKRAFGFSVTIYDRPEASTVAVSRAGTNRQAGATVQFRPLALIIPNYMGPMQECRFYGKPPFTQLFVILRKEMV